MIPLGIGLGCMSHNEVLPDFYSRDKHIDHNTFTSFFTGFCKNSCGCGLNLENK